MTSKTFSFKELILAGECLDRPSERLKGESKTESLTKDSRIIIMTNSGISKSGYKALTFALNDSDNLRSASSMSTLRFSIQDENTTAEYLPE